MSTRISVAEMDEAIGVGDTINIWTLEEKEVEVTKVTKRTDNSVDELSTKSTASGFEYHWNVFGSDHKIEVVKKAPKQPQHWPPQLEDVWQAGDELYHMLGRKLYRASDPGTIWTSPENLLKSCNGNYGEHVRELKLVYRKGNDPNV